jgi:hypothetical protein
LCYNFSNIKFKETRMAQVWCYTLAGSEDAGRPIDNVFDINGAAVDPNRVESHMLYVVDDAHPDLSKDGSTILYTSPTGILDVMILDALMKWAREPLDVTGLTAMAGSDTIDLSWDDATRPVTYYGEGVTYNGEVVTFNAPPTEYEIDITPRDNPNYPQRVSGTTHTIDSLNPDTEYTITVTACNLYGCSKPAVTVVTTSTAAAATNTKKKKTKSTKSKEAKGS